MVATSCQLINPLGGDFIFKKPQSYSGSIAFIYKYP